MHHTNNEQSLIIIHGILESQCLPFMFTSFQSTMLSVWHYSCIILRSSFFSDRVIFPTFGHTIPGREYPFEFFSPYFSCRILVPFVLFVFFFVVGDGLWSMFRKWSWIAFQFADLMIWGILVHRSSYFGYYYRFQIAFEICSSRHLNHTHITSLCSRMRIKH